MSPGFRRSRTIVVTAVQAIPDWAAAVGASVISAGALDDEATEAVKALAAADCVMVDAADAGFLAQARHVHLLDDSVQIVAVTPPDRLQATRRAILYTPGLGEIWIASPTEVTGALEERAAGVTRKRRRYARTRSRIASEAVSSSPQRAERAIISDAYLAGLLRVLADPVFSVGSTGRILSVNAAAESNIAAEGQLIGEPLHRVLGLENEQAALGLLESSHHTPSRIRFRNAAGEMRLGELRSSPMLVTGATAWAVVIHDITETQAMVDRLQETARALQDSEATYRGLVDALPTLAWTARADGYIDWYNRRWYEYTGTTSSQMAGWGWQTVHDPAVLPEVMKNWRRSIDTGMPFEMTFPIRGADGVFRSFLTRVVPLRDAHGRVLRWFGTNTDVQAERESRERIEQLQAVTSALAGAQTLEEVASVIVAKAVAATGAATGMLAVCNSNGGEVRVVQQVGLEKLPGADDPQFIVKLPGPSAECLRTGEPVFIESRDGRHGLAERYPAIIAMFDLLHVRALAALPLTVAGEMVGVLTFSFTRPKTFLPAEQAFFLSLARQCAQALERARLFAAERDARRAADEANQAKSQFLATMSHELRTPLNAINGHVSLVLEEIYGPVSAEQRAALERVVRAQQHLLGVINDVLSFARIESGKMDFRLADVDSAELVRDVLPLIEPQLTRKGLLLDVAVPAQDSPPPPSVYVDGDKVGQILVNLLSNAVKFTPAGGRISVTVDPATNGKERAVEVRVADTGIGIPQEMQESIFQPFVQVRSDPNRIREGTGLGLAISRDLARGMGGELRVESVEGQGSTFILSLPVSPSSGG